MLLLHQDDPAETWNERDFFLKTLDTEKQSLKAILKDLLLLVCCGPCLASLD